MGKKAKDLHKLNPNQPLSGDLNQEDNLFQLAKVTKKRAVFEAGKPGWRSLKSTKLKKKKNKPAETETSLCLLSSLCKIYGNFDIYG